jgi:hypothetical protein
VKRYVKHERAIWKFKEGDTEKIFEVIILRKLRGYTYRYEVLPIEDRTRANKFNYCYEQVIDGRELIPWREYTNP